MYTAFTYIIYFGILASVLYALIFSFKSKRLNNPIDRGLMSAKMNIAMGIMLTLLSVVQLFLIKKVGEGSTVRVLVGTAFLLLGLYNIFAGIRNNKLFKTQLKRQGTSKKKSN